VDELLDQPSPHDLDAEMAVLGGMMLDASTIPAVTGLLSAQSYYLQAHQHIHAAIVALHAAGTPVDPVLVLDELRCRGDLDEIDDGELTAQYAGPRRTVTRRADRRADQRHRSRD
jgi:replicative DNA helicase